MLNYAIIGFGGLGKGHFGNTEALSKIHNDVKLTAICDVDEETFTKNVATNLGEDNSSLDLSAYKLYTDYKEMFEKEKLDFIITALPTYLHDEVAIYAMERKIHVFSEKPMAISMEKAENMIKASRENNVKLMIGQCLRFFPEYILLKEMIDSKKYGNVVKATFARISAFPFWSWQNWYADEAKSGGATLDLHIHDLDFISYVFGKPKGVFAAATNLIEKHDSVTTTYIYDDKTVVAAGEWLPAKTYPFSVSYRITFENAVLELSDGKLMLYNNEEAKEITIPDGNGYLDEVAEFISCIKEDRESLINPPEATLTTMEIALAEKKSSDLKQIVML